MPTNIFNKSYTFWCWLTAKLLEKRQVTTFLSQQELELQLQVNDMDVLLSYLTDLRADGFESIARSC